MAFKSLQFDAAASPDQSATVAIPVALGSTFAIRGAIYVPALPAGPPDTYHMAWMGTDGSGLAASYSHGVGVTYEGKAYAYLFAGGGALQLLSAAGVISAPGWYQVVIAASGGNVRLMVAPEGGALTQVATAAMGVPFEPTLLILGKTAGSVVGIGGGGSDWGGRVADIQIFSADPGNTFLENTTWLRLEGDEADLEVYHRIDEGTGIALADQVAGGPAGTVNNATWHSADSSPFPHDPVVGGRMKNMSFAKRELMAGSHYDSHSKFLCTDGAGDLIDYSELLAEGGVEWEEETDGRVIQATVQLVRRDESGESLAPLMEGSARNTDGLGGYAPALYANRYCEFWDAITEHGVAPTDEDWVLMWSGRLDEPRFDGRAAITLGTRDEGGRLEEVQIEEERTYNTPATALGDLLQEVLDDNPAHDTDPVPTLVVEGDPDWFLDKHVQPLARLFPALQELVDQIGWDLRYRWNETNDFGLVLSEPRRGVTVPDTTWGPDDYSHVPLARINAVNVRNRIEVVRRDTAGVLRRKSYVDNVSADLFDRRYMRVGGDAIAAITEEDESDRLGEAMLSDLAYPEFDHAYRFPRPNPYAMLGDYYAFSPNGVTYDEEQTGAVVKISHRRTRSERSTTIYTTGLPRSAYARWRTKEDPRQPPRILTHTLDHDPVGTLALGFTTSVAVVEVRVWSRSGESPLDANGIPDDSYLKAILPKDVLATSWPVRDGEEFVVIRALDKDGRPDQVEETVEITGVGGGTGGGGGGGPGTAPTEAPPRPVMSAGAVSAPNQAANLAWVNTNTVDSLEVDWYEDGVLVATTTRPAGSTTATRNYTSPPLVRARAQIRYTNGGGDGPNSPMSNEVKLYGV